MPAADISEVQVMFHDERRGREEYNPPMKKAEVRLTALVPEGSDGLVALNFVEKMVRDKVREMLSISGAAPAAETTEIPPTSSGSQASPSDEPTAGEPARRTRRTKAQIEADEAAAKAAQTGAAAAPADTAPSTDAAAPAASAAEPQTASEGAVGETGLDEWEAAAPATVSITDQELNHTCSVTAERCKDPAKVKATILKFSPGGDDWDPAKPGGRRFTVNDIPANQRADFIAQLKAL